MGVIKTFVFKWGVFLIFKSFELLRLLIRAILFWWLGFDKAAEKDSKVH
jgi:hypothetical protein